MLQDLPDIIAIEEASFSSPWSHESLRAEFDNRVARYYVLETDAGTVVGYADLWLIADEGQLANIAVHPSARGLGYGENPAADGYGRRLSRRLARRSFWKYGRRIASAIALYEKLGYEKVALRKGYYSQPVEDAYIMNCPKENYPWPGHLL